VMGDRARVHEVRGVVADDGRLALRRGLAPDGLLEAPGGDRDAAAHPLRGAVGPALAVDLERQADRLQAATELRPALKAHFFLSAFFLASSRLRIASAVLSLIRCRTPFYGRRSGRGRRGRSRDPPPPPASPR